MHVRALTDSRVLVTGASSGIGRDTALACAARGAVPVLVARDAGALAALAEEIATTHGITATALPCDVRDVADLTKLLQDEDDRAPIDHVIANAGIGLYGPFATATWSQIDDVLRTNVDGAFATVHALLPRLITRRRGSIVLVSSVLGKRALAWNAAYSASKYALHGLADALRLEVAPLGIHVGVVCPGRTRTAFHARIHTSARQESRRAVPEASAAEVAEAIMGCITRRWREVVVPRSSLAYTLVGVHVPRLADLLLSRAVPRPHGH